MNPILTAVIVLSSVGALAGIMLIVAAKLMAVPIDNNAKKIEEALPSANCGACGFAGCADYAAAVAAGNAATNLCVPGGEKTAAELAAILGTEALSAEDKIGFVACHGSYDSTHDKYDYNGILSCAACNMYFAGRSDCAYGCLGIGDCVSVCRFGALSIRNGVAHIDPTRCTGCGACAAKCPKGLIHIVPRSTKTVVICSNRDRGNITHKTCIRGCMGCAKCVRVCPNGAIVIENNLAHVDVEKCQSCGACVLACPVSAPSVLSKN